MQSNHLAAITGIFLGLVSTGCYGKAGPHMVHVTGQVTYDNRPVEMGTVYFRAVDGSNTYAGKIDHGIYQADVTPGDKRIEVLGFRTIPGKFREDNPGELTPVREMHIPEKYHQKTTLETTIPEDAYDFQVDLLMSR